MNYAKAQKSDAEKIYALLQETIKKRYTCCYPKKVISQICESYSLDAILSDIYKGNVRLCRNDKALLGCAFIAENHIKDLFIDSQYLDWEYGQFLLGCLEQELCDMYDAVYVEASLPSCIFYERQGYHTLQHVPMDMEGTALLHVIMEKNLANHNCLINYEGKVFQPVQNTANGEVNDSTRFYYHQKGNLLYADYQGGDIKKGFLIGTVADHGELDFHYQHVNVHDQVRMGKCHSVPEYQKDGSLHLLEEWQWLNGDESFGTSLLMEV